MLVKIFVASFLIGNMVMLNKRLEDPKNAETPTAVIQIICIIASGVWLGMNW